MKKCIVFLVLLIAIMPITYAGFFDFITGKVTSGADQLKMYFTADNMYQLYVNDQFVGSTTGTVWDWADAENYIVNLKDGKNVIAVKATNFGAKGGIFGEFFYADKRFVTDASWKYSLQEQANWNKIAFDDSSWSNAVVHGNSGDYPWTQVRGFPTPVPNTFWIWSSKNDYNNSDPVVYFRYSFDYRPSQTNQPPEINIFANPNSGIAPLSVNLSAVGIDPDGYIASYNWIFGDGQGASQQSVMHTFQNPNTYSIILTATDDKGATATKSIQIIVSSQPAESRCVDSDNGLNYYQQGTCTKTSPNGSVQTFGDICQGNLLHERYCQENGCASSIYACENGCKNGKCIRANEAACGDGFCNGVETCLSCAKDCGACNATQPPPQQNDTLPVPQQNNTIPPIPNNNKCTDSDNGINLLTKGTVTTSTGEKITDECIVNAYLTSSGKPWTYGVKETYCDNGYKFGQYDCPAGYACNDGACKIMSCTPGTKCVDGSTIGYQNEKCIFSEIKHCDFDCVNGKCNVGCDDKDANDQNHYFVKSSCSDSTGVHEDFCDTASSVRDYYCTGSWDGKQWVNKACAAGGYVCNYGCVDGACLTSAPVQSCGNGKCDSVETCSSCAKDCGACNVTQPAPACKTSTDCGTTGFTGNYFCQTGDVYRSYSTYVCAGAGMPNVTCGHYTEQRLIDDCAANEQCVSGNANCQLVVPTCSNGVKEGLCLSECGAFSACNGKQPGTEYRCDDNKLPSATGSNWCLCYQEFNCDGRIVQGELCSTGGMWSRLKEPKYNICLTDCGADNRCNLRQVGSEFTCDSAGTYTATGDKKCLCNSMCKLEIILCGDGTCSSGETKGNCLQDCKVCGDNACDSPYETATNCASDCSQVSPGFSSVVLEATADVWIEDGYNRSNYNMLGVGLDYGNPKKRALINFDTSSLAGKSVNSAKLQLYYDYCHGGTPLSPTEIRAHRIKKSWEESTATRDKRTSSEYWSTPYLDFTNDADSIIAGSVQIDSQGTYNIDITNLIKTWVSGKYPNYGMLLWSTEENGDGREIGICDRRFKSREYSEAIKRPKLIIEYSSSPVALCGNGLCDSTETKQSCLQDCRVCGDNICDTGYEDSSNCLTDCPLPQTSSKIILEAVADVWIQDESNYNINTYNWLAVGKFINHPKERSLIRFDTSSLAGKEIISSKLYVFNYGAQCTAGFGSVPVQVHQVMLNWDESAATVSKRTSTQNWNTPYLDFSVDAKPNAEASGVLDGLQVFNAFDLTNLTKRWVSGQAANYGVLIWSQNENSDGCDRKLEARESADATKRPKLAVQYSLAQASSCGDGTCSSGETSSNCAADCPLLLEPIIQNGFPVELDCNGELSSSVLVDLDLDGNKEIVMGSMCKKLYALHHDGTPVSGFPVSTEFVVAKTPAVGDIDNDCKPEIVIKGDGNGRNLYVFENDGSIKQGWPQSTQDYSSTKLVSLANVNDDPFLELITTTLDGIAIYNKDGNIILSKNFTTRDPQFGVIYGGTESYTTVADFNNDGKAEIFFAFQDPVGRVSADLFLMDGKGNNLPGWPKRIPLKTATLPFIIGAAGDIDNDGDIEIVLRAGQSGDLYAFNPDGSIVNGWPKSLNIQGDSTLYNGEAITLADLNHDGYLEIILPIGIVKSGGNYGEVLIFTYNGNPYPGWNVPIIKSWLKNSVITADIDNDGEMEIIGVTEPWGFGLNQSMLYSFNLDGTNVSNYTMITKSNRLNQVGLGLQSSPSASDIDKDGKLELVFSSGPYVYVLNTGTPASNSAVEWPTSNADPWNTGAYKDNSMFTGTVGQGCGGSSLYCGDGTCSSGETSTNCAIDCTSTQQQTTSTGEMTTINPTYQNGTTVSLATQQTGSAITQEGAALSAISQEPTVPESVCAGCFIEKKCLSIGVRTLTDGQAVYCDSNRKLNIMKEGGIICTNNYECVSNSCRKGVCLSVEELKSKGAIQDILDFLAGIFS